MPSIVAVLVLAVCLVAAVGVEGKPSPAIVKRLRDFQRPDELDVASAKALHQDLLSRSRTMESLHGHRHTTFSRPAPPPAPPGPGPSPSSNNSLPVIYPTSFGADPTGQNDSTAAFVKAVAALLKGGAPHHMAEGINDLGGATLDLAGGQYLISQPIIIPPYYGNLLIARGTLRASPSFPSDQWLLQIGDSTCNPPSGQGSCNEFVNVADVLFDSQHVAAGGVKVTHVMGTTIGPAFFIGYTQVGIKIDGGHEVMVLENWLAEYYWNEPKPKNSTSVGVQINGNDHYLDDVIVFDYTNVGVEVNGAANILSGVHTWNGGGVGIAVNSYQTRLIGCYLDFNTLVILDPTQTVVENTFFLDTHTIFEASHGNIDGVLMRFNTYTGGQSVELVGSFPNPKAVSIAEEINGNRFTRVRASQTQQQGTVWRFDFSSQLLFPKIDYVVYTLSTADRGVEHRALPPQGLVVEIHSDQATDGTVSIEVAQAL